jgi:MerR family mercuric resistance operon transcriptional regulator
VETVRYYQRRGLLANPRPQKTGVTASATTAPTRSAACALHPRGAGGGFTLEEIAELLHLDSTGDRPRARAMAQSRIDALDAKIAELERARQSLAKLARTAPRAARARARSSPRSKAPDIGALRGLRQPRCSACAPRFGITGASRCSCWRSPSSSARPCRRLHGLRRRVVG